MAGLYIGAMSSRAHGWCRPTALFLASAICGCADRAASAPEATPLPAPVEVADFRGGPRSPDALTDASNLIAAAYGTPAPADVRPVARYSGSFTRSGALQQVVLYTRDGPLSGPSARPSLLAVLEDDRVVAQFVVPDVVYHDIAAALDLDGDSLHDVVLVAQAYQMGQITLQADALSLAGGQRRAVATFGTVYENTCDVPLGERSVTAATVVQTAGGSLARENYRADCTSDGTPPDMASFAPLDAALQPVAR